VLPVFMEHHQRLAVAAKTKAFAQRFGLTDYTQMRIHFGSRWAYRLQGQILSERLEGTVFPSRMAADRNLNQMFPMLVAQDKAKNFIEQLPVTQTRLLSDHKYDCDAPVWEVPEWFGEKIQKIPMTLQVIQEADENSHKLRLYAKQLPDMPEPLSRSTYKSRIEFSANEN
jgi:hypothetical protein